MERLCTKSLAVAFVLILFQLGCIHGQAQGATTQDQASQKVMPSSTPPAAVTPAPSLPPPAVNQAAPNQAIVTYRDGELAVEADNTPLYEILRTISSRTGAKIDIPPQANARVTRQIGPAPIGEIVDSLLNGFGLNYIIEGWADPNVPVKVIFLSEGGRSDGRPSVEVQGVDVAAIEQLRQQLGAEQRQALNERRQMILQHLAQR